MTIELGGVFILLAALLWYQVATYNGVRAALYQTAKLSHSAMRSGMRFGQGMQYARTDAEREKVEERNRKELECVAKRNRILEEWIASYSFYHLLSVPFADTDEDCASTATWSFQAET